MEHSVLTGNSIEEPCISLKSLLCTGIELLAGSCTLADGRASFGQPGQPFRHGRTRTFASGDPTRLANRELAPDSAPAHASASGIDAANVPSDDTPPRKDSNWEYLVALTALSVVICYADRSNLSTAILPMSLEFGWDKVRRGQPVVATAPHEWFASRLAVNREAGGRY